MKKAVSILMLASMAIATSANASQFNYDFAEVSYGVQGGSSDIDGNGSLALTGSYDLKPNINLLGAFTKGGGVNTIQGGIGYHKPIKRGTDGLASVHLSNDNIEGTGITFKGGLRHDFSNDFEGEISVNYTHVNKSRMGITAGSRYHFTREMSAGLGVNDKGALLFNLRMPY